VACILQSQQPSLTYVQSTTITFQPTKEVSYVGKVKPSIILGYNEQLIQYDLENKLPSQQVVIATCHVTPNVQ
jgi:hypothetical protein